MRQVRKWFEDGKEFFELVGCRRKPQLAATDVLHRHKEAVQKVRTRLFEKNCMRAQVVRHIAPLGEKMELVARDFRDWM